MVEKREPMLVRFRPSGPPEKSASQMRRCRQFAFTSEDLTGQAELTQCFGDHPVEFGL
jgi:hypothetical protein